jgi:transcriptional regulator with XRE-family HTH domain
MMRQVRQNYPVETFGSRLRKKREAKGISQSALGDHCGVSRNAVSLWESNDSSPTVPNLVKACELLEASADELLGLTPEKLSVSGFPPKSIRALRKINELPRDMRETILVLIDSISAGNVTPLPVPKTRRVESGDLAAILDEIDAYCKGHKVSPPSAMRAHWIEMMLEYASESKSKNEQPNYSAKIIELARAAR